MMPLARLIDDLRNVSAAGADAARGDDWLSVSRYEVIRLSLLGDLVARAATDLTARDAVHEALAWGEPINTALNQGRDRLNARSGEMAKAGRAGAAYARAGVSA